MTAARARRRAAALIAYELRRGEPPGGHPDDSTADGLRMLEAFDRIADEMERRAGTEYETVCREQHGESPAPRGER